MTRSSSQSGRVSARILAAVAFGVYFMIGFVGYAFAASTAETASSAADTAGDALLDVGSGIVNAFAHGQPALGAILLLMAAVGLLRRYGGDKWPALRGDLGGTLLLFALTFLGVLAAKAPAGWGAVLDAGVLWAAFKLAAGAGTGYTLLKRLGTYALARWGASLPSWARALLNMATYLFKSPGQEAVEKAEAAGAAAVAAKPALGFTSPKELP